MPREAATFTIERVEGPSAQRSRVRLSFSMDASRSRSMSRPGAVLDDVERELAGADADALLLHLVDEVVDARSLRLAGAAEGHRDADLLLDLDRHVLGDVAEPRPLGDALQKAAGRSLGAVVLLQARQQLQELLAEARGCRSRAARGRARGRSASRRRADRTRSSVRSGRAFRGDGCPRPFVGGSLQESPDGRGAPPLSTPRILSVSSAGIPKG